MKKNKEYHTDYIKKRDYLFFLFYFTFISAAGLAFASIFLTQAITGFFIRSAPYSLVILGGLYLLTTISTIYIATWLEMKLWRKYFIISSLIFTLGFIGRRIITE